MSEDPSDAPVADTKECQFCAETIKAAAVKCRFCHSSLVEKVAEAGPGAAAGVPPLTGSSSQKTVLSSAEGVQDFKCPSCGSAHLELRTGRRMDGKDSVTSVGKAFGGQQLLGVVGLVVSTTQIVVDVVDRKEQRYTCLKCGDSGPVRKAIRDGEQTITLEGGSAMRVNISNGNRHGPYAVTDGSGRVIASGGYAKGKLDGLTESFHDDGTVAQKTLYDRGKVRYTESFAKETGERITRSDYSRGKLHGAVTAYHPNGQIRQRTAYTYGMINGANEVFDHEGSLILRENFRAGIRRSEVQGPAALITMPEASQLLQVSCVRCHEKSIQKELLCQECEEVIEMGRVDTDDLDQLGLDMKTFLWTWGNRTTQRLGELFSDGAVVSYPQISGLSFEGMRQIVTSFSLIFMTEPTLSVNLIAKESDEVWLRYITRSKRQGVLMHVSRVSVSDGLITQMENFIAQQQRVDASIDEPDLFKDSAAIVGSSGALAEALGIDTAELDQTEPDVGE